MYTGTPVSYTHLDVYKRQHGTKSVNDLTECVSLNSSSKFWITFKKFLSYIYKKLYILMVINYVCLGKH